MIYARAGDWSYNQHNNQQGNNIIKVTNNSNVEMRLTSLTTNLGVAASGTSANWGDYCTGNGASVTLYLSTSYNSDSNISDSHTISTTRGTYSSADKTKRSYKTNDLPSVTFKFKNGVTMAPNSSLTFYYRRASGSNTIVCPKDGSNWNGSAYQYYHVTGTAEEPYKTPTITLSGDTYSRHDVERKVSIGSNTSGDNSATIVYVNVNSQGDDKTSIGNGSGDYKFTPNNKKVNDGVEYNVTAKRVHNSKTSLSASKSLTLRTYRTPIINEVKLNPSSFSGIGNSTLSWRCNGRRWPTSAEGDFITQYKFGSGSYKDTGVNGDNGAETNVTNTKSLTLNQSIINANISDTDRAKEKITITITMKRTNPTTGVIAEAKSGNITIQFWPKYEIENSSLVYRDPKTQSIIQRGTTQYVDELPVIQVDWTYPKDADRGVINGYIVRIYRNNQTTKVGDDHVYYTTDLKYSTTFNTKTELKRGEVNYIQIIPFYTLPNGTKKEGPSRKYPFIKPISKLAKPVIEYPVNNTTWHNKDFRILMKCPSDGDFNEIGISASNYRYKEMEIALKINNGSYIIYTFNNNGNAFSCNSLSYQKAICIYPYLLFNNSNITKCTMKVRFQKNYYENVWSVWSDEVNLNIVPVNELSLVKQQTKILIQHYTTIYNYSTRLYNVYHREAYPYNINRKQYDIVLASDYDDMFKSILAIQSKINNYCSYDRTNLKMNQVINGLKDNNKSTRGEYITANKIDNNPQGRNYMNILVQSMNLLY